MSEFKLCENGHYFPNDQKKCPYCPGGSIDDNPTNNNFIDNSSSSLDKTFMDVEPSQQTQIFGEPESNNLNRTQIFTGNDSPAIGSFGGDIPSFNAEPVLTNVRKLVGWLVSFTIDANGIDFKLYEGRNVIGSSSQADIIVSDDPAVSGKHLTILYRMGHFKFKDELSTNGTFINDVFEEEGNLKDGDMIKIGETIFKFRSIA